MKTLDMADKYEPLSYEDAPDSTPTIKVQVPTFTDQVVLSGENDDFDLHGERDTVPSPPSYPECVPGHTENKYPGVGLLMTLGFGLIFWSTLAYFIFR